LKVLAPNFITFRRVAAAVAAITLVAGCGGNTMESEALEPHEIFQRYQVHYDKASDVTWIQADFFQNSPAGVPLELTGSMTVTDNGVVLERPTDFAPYYKKSLPGFVAVHGFVFTHKDGSTDAHSITLEPIAPLRPPTPTERFDVGGTQFPDGLRGTLLEPAQWHVSTTEMTHTFLWDGAPVRENDSVYLIIESALGRLDRPVQPITLNPSSPGGLLPTSGVFSETTRTAKYFAVETPGNVGVTLSKSDLEAIGAGNRTIKFQRVTRLRKHVPNAQGVEQLRVTLSASYVSETVPVSFEKRDTKSR
jgi:hypothetical protein